jgi:hypothetical protein
MDQGALTVCVLGESPLIYNRLSFKVRKELLMPKGKKNAAEKAGSLKHDPLEEFRASAYTNKYEGASRLQLLGAMFKGAMETAALESPGTKKSQIGRLCYIEENRVDLFGLPQLFMSVVRSADMNKTPDVRTRMIVPKWACKFTVRFMMPTIRDQSVANLLALAGQIAGVGDYRVEKGAGAYGRFKLVSESDAEYKAICKLGRVHQDKAIESPVSYDDETDELLSWFQVEVKRRGFKVVGE